MAYALGPVKPHVKYAADTVGPMFGITTIYGVASRSYDSDHPLGLALDYMVGGNKATGEALANYMQANASKFGVKYIIWYQRIWNVERSGEGWRAMEDRGSVTANHMDHVHVSFLASVSGVVNAGDGLLPIIPWGFSNGPDNDPLDPGLEAATGAIGILTWLSDGKNWLRIAIIVSGVALLLLGLAKLAASQTGIIDTARKAVNK